MSELILIMIQSLIKKALMGLFLRNAQKPPYSVTIKLGFQS
jgi:hypothetical protein